MKGHVMDHTWVTEDGSHYGNIDLIYAYIGYMQTVKTWVTALCLCLYIAFVAGKLNTNSHTISM